MKNHEMNDEVRKTMESIEGIRRADPGPYFYSRLKARMEPTVESAMQWYWKLAFSLLLVINIGSYWMLSDESSTSTDEVANSLAEEYFDYTINYDELLTLEQGQ